MRSEKLEFEKLNNTRDLGSIFTKDGSKIKANKLFRSGNVFPDSETDKANLNDLVDTIVDFRTDAEVYEKPDPKLKDVKLYNIEVVGNKSVGISKEKGFEHSLIDLMRDAYHCKLFMEGMYKGFFDKSCLDAYKEFFRILLEDHKKGVLFHCTAGKDRTGFASVLIELLLGVSWENIVEDYMYTAECSKEEIQRLSDWFVYKIGEDTPEIRQAVDYAFSPQEEYLEILKQTFKERYSSLEEFYKKELGLDETKVKRFKELYLE